MTVAVRHASEYSPRSLRRKNDLAFAASKKSVMDRYRLGSGDDPTAWRCSKYKKIANASAARHDMIDAAVEVLVVASDERDMAAATTSSTMRITLAAYTACKLLVGRKIAFPTYHFTP